MYSSTNLRGQWLHSLRKVKKSHNMWVSLNSKGFRNQKKRPTCHPCKYRLTHADVFSKSSSTSSSDYHYRHHQAPCFCRTLMVAPWPDSVLLAKDRVATAALASVAVAVDRDAAAATAASCRSLSAWRRWESATSAHAAAISISSNISHLRENNKKRE